MRIALIHALKHSIAPIEASFARLWPEATLANLLDDSLSADLARAGALDAAMTARFLTLARYAAGCGARGILFTCSAFGPCIEACARELAPIPVLKPNEAMIEDAAAALARSAAAMLVPSDTAGRLSAVAPTPAAVADPMGAAVTDSAGTGARAAGGRAAGGRIGLLASFAPTLASMPQEFAAAAPNATIVPALADRALAALDAGDAAGHDREAAAAARALAGCDVIALAQFSLARAADAVAAATGRPVLTTPDSAVRKLRRLLAE